MKKNRMAFSYPLLAVLSVIAGLQEVVAATPDLMVVPQPRRIEWRTGSFRLDDQRPILVSQQGTAEERFAVAEMQMFLRERIDLNLRIQGMPESGTVSPGILIGNPERDPVVANRMTDLGLSISEPMVDEGYVLAVDSDGIVIGARTSAGILYGTMTLRQMLAGRVEDGMLPGVAIHDWPEFQIRAIQDCISYGQVSTMENFKDIIRFLAEYKMNTLFLYIEDLYRLEAYPTIGVGRGALTREQVDELEAYAGPFNVEIIPDFEMLGNQPALLQLVDEVRPLAEFPGAHTFAITEETYEFLEHCVREMAAAFDSQYFHAGLDESWDLGYGKTEELINRVGTSTVHVDHYLRLNEIFRKYGKTMIMYSDYLLKYPESMGRLSRSIIQMDWQHGLDPARIESMQGFLDAGFTHITSSALRDYHYFFPRFDEGMDKSVRVVDGSLRYKELGGRVLGSMIASWGDNGSKNFKENNYYGYAYFGELLWSPERQDVSEFGKRFFLQRYGPGTAPYLQAIYAMLERWPEQWDRSLRDTFRHPFLPRNKGYVPTWEEFHHVEKDAQAVLGLLEELDPKVRCRKGDLGFLRFAAHSHVHYVRSQRLVQALQKTGTFQESPEAVRRVQAQYLEESRALRQDLIRLRDEFKSLWLRTNIPAGLQYAVDEYDMLIKTWADTEQRLQAGQFAFEPMTPARFIYHPDGYTKKAKVQHSWFRMTFEKPDEVRRAHLQLQGDTHIVIFVNGRRIGEQFMRRGLPAPVNPRLLQLYDIAPYLQSGTNVIAVEAHNYGTRNSSLEPGGPLRCGGFIMYGEIVDGNGQLQQLVSDDSWHVSDRNPDGWNEPAFQARGWMNAHSDTNPTVLVTYPDFAHNIKGYSVRR